LGLGLGLARLNQSAAVEVATVDHLVRVRVRVRVRVKVRVRVRVKVRVRARVRHRVTTEDHLWCHGTAVLGVPCVHHRMLSAVPTPTPAGVRVRVSPNVPNPNPNVPLPGTYGSPEAGMRTAHVPCVGPRGKLPCASGMYGTQEAGTVRRPRHVRVNTEDHLIHL
jgi:hypothetical protein